MAEDMSPEEFKIGDAAAKLVVGRALAEFVYGAQARLPHEEVGQRMEKFLTSLDGYIEWRTTGLILEAIRKMVEEEP